MKSLITTKGLSHVRCVLTDPQDSAVYEEARTGLPSPHCRKKSHGFHHWTDDAHIIFHTRFSPLRAWLKEERQWQLFFPVWIQPTIASGTSALMAALSGLQRDLLPSDPSVLPSLTPWSIEALEVPRGPSSSKAVIHLCFWGPCKDLRDVSSAPLGAGNHVNDRQTFHLRLWHELCHFLLYLRSPSSSTLSGSAFICLGLGECRFQEMRDESGMGHLFPTSR